MVPGFLDALQIEVKRAVERATQSGWPTEVETIFLGGGTPTHLGGEDLERLLGIVTQAFPLVEGGEFSTEANPLDCDPSRLETLKQFGVNRISLGGQSFQAKKLDVLERDHNPKQLHASLDAVCQLFDNVSLDLIFASPGETLPEWQEDLRQAAAYPLAHLSTYGLTIERGSAFYGRMLKDTIREVDEDLQAEMYETTIEHLTQQDFEHYEISSFAKSQQRCRHNQVYWSGEPWHAFGPGAACYVPSGTATNQRQGLMERRVNHRSTTAYIRRVLGGRSPVAERDEIPPEQQLRERLVFGLRQIDGVDMDELSQWWGSSIDALFSPYLERYIDSGWLIRHANHLRLTPTGLLISDSLWPNLLG